MFLPFFWGRHVIMPYAVAVGRIPAALGERGTHGDVVWGVDTRMEKSRQTRTLRHSDISPPFVRVVPPPPRKHAYLLPHSEVGLEEGAPLSRHPISRAYNHVSE